MKAKDLAYLLNNFSYISDKISEDYHNRIGSENTSTAFLEILSIHTGNSIKFSLTEGWIPTISSDKENDIIVNIPQKLGIPIVLGYLLISGANQYQEFRNKQLDNQIKEIELQLKKTELIKAITEEETINYKEKESIPLNIQNYLNNKVPEVKIKVLDTLKFIYKNQDWEIVIINNIEIKTKEK
ncbi:MAG: hypothetical protein LBL58_08420 [Tannerellaceae bacterium]|nr:hypothetical protein [Tannerellaceae bacterium]